MKKKTSKAPLFIALGFVVLLVGTGVVVGTEAKKELLDRFSPTKMPASITPGPVSIEGQVTCLPHKPGPDGSSTAECAYGFMSSTGHYYGLKDPKNENDPNWFQSPLYTAKRVRINGTLTGETSSTYDIVGTIVLDSFDVLEENDREPELE